jgi:anhydro-N-acetylmuramic acid kinase
MRVIGLMSGTSLDGIDAAAVDVILRDDVLEVTPVHSASTPYPPDLRELLGRSLPRQPVTAQEWCELDTRVGQAFAQAAALLARELAPQPQLVVSHGQTVFHWAEDGRVRGTLQVGQPAWIAEATGLPVVSDLRARDVAAGGQGAPLVSAFDVLWLRGRLGNPVALNLGGIANLTADVHSEEPLAYDIGPANALIDAAVERITRGAQTFDRDGDAAARGQVDDGLLEHLLSEPYYSLRAPKSTGKELFNAAYLENALARRRAVKDDDLVATLTALTARTVAEASLSHSPTAVIAAGGGTSNPTLMRMLEEALGEIPLVTADTLGIPSGDKEAIAFAVLGFLTWHGVPASLPSATGARHASVLGSITPGRHPLVLPPTATAPTRLVLTAPR